jgi:hypothetical protein
VVGKAAQPALPLSARAVLRKLIEAANELMMNFVGRRGVAKWFMIHRPAPTPRRTSNVFDQIAYSHLYGFGDLYQRPDRDVQIAPFDLPNKIVVEVSAFGQFLLSETRLLATGANLFTQNSPK